MYRYNVKLDYVVMKEVSLVAYLVSFLSIIKRQA
ncbi:uncharacterized protein METZ01_LOCUS277777 [marine metagenome]|uniref:Uncharacterized protein n=1 Tax=marine metagenome TaxID=408172 RepID=A0A382KN91_9ZZZZ